MDTVKKSKLRRKWRKEEHFVATSAGDISFLSVTCLLEIKQDGEYERASTKMAQHGRLEMEDDVNDHLNVSNNLMPHVTSDN